MINSKGYLIGTKLNAVSIHQYLLPNLTTVTTAKYVYNVLDKSLSFKTSIDMLTKKTF